MRHLKSVTTGFLLLFVSPVVVYSSQIDIDSIHNECYSLIKDSNYAGAYELALSNLNIDLSPEDKSEFYFIMAWSKRKQNEFSESISLYEKAIEFTGFPDNKARLIKNLGAVLHYVNLFDQAIKEYDRAIKLSKIWSPNNFYNKALSQIAISDYAGAAESLEAGLSVCEELENEYYKAKLWNQYGVIERDFYEQTGKAKHANLARQYFSHVLENKKNTTNNGMLTKSFVNEEVKTACCIQFLNG